MSSESTNTAEGLLLFSALGACVWLHHNRRIHEAPRLRVYEGSCHCEAVKFRVRAPGHLTAWECNCSICLMKKNAHFVVPTSQFELVSGKSDITTYTFNTRKAQHYFCKHCGVQSYYVPRSNPDGIGVTLACVRGVESFEVKEFDGQNWEEFINQSGIQKFSEVSNN